MAVLTAGPMVGMEVMGAVRVEAARVEATAVAAKGASDASLR